MSKTAPVEKHQPNAPTALTKKEILRQQDFVDNLVHQLIEELLEKKRDWDIHVTGNVRDAIIRQLEFFGLVKEDELYPFLQENDEGGSSFCNLQCDVCDHQFDGEYGDEKCPVCGGLAIPRPTSDCDIEDEISGNRASFAGAIAECRTNPFKISIQFGVIVFMFLLIFFVLPLIFNGLQKP